MPQEFYELPATENIETLRVEINRVFDDISRRLNFMVPDGDNIDVGGRKFTNLTPGVSSGDSLSYDQLLLLLAGYIRRDGTLSFLGNQSMGGNKLTSVGDATAAGDATSFGFLNAVINKGIWVKGTVTDSGGLNVSWDANFVIYNGTAAGLVSISSGSGTCTDNVTNHLVWRSGTTLQLVAGEPLTTDVSVAHISCQDGDIWDLDQEPALSTVIRDIQHGLEEAFPVYVAEGCQVQEDTDATNAFDVSLLAGEYYHDLHIEHVVSQIDSRTTAMRRWYHSAGAWTSDTNAEIDTGFYDDGTNKAAVAVGKYYKWAFFFTTTEIHAVYPNAQYNTEADAIDADPPPKPPGLEEMPDSTTYVFKTGDAAFEPSTSDRWADIRQRIGVGTGGGGGVSAWIGLLDTPASRAGQALKLTQVNSAETALEFIDNAIKSGSTVPTSPFTNQLFMHTPTGRKVLLLYDGANWKPLIHFGTTVLYVNGASGTDTINNGGATGASAFATIQYAIDSISHTYGGDITINIAAGTYAENIDIQGKEASGPYTLTLVGALTTLSSITASAGTIGGVAGGTVTKSAGTWTANKLLVGTSGNNNGIYRLITSFVGNVATIVGTWTEGGAIVLNDTFDVMDWGTIISGSVTTKLGQKAVVLEDLHVNSGTVGIYMDPYSAIDINRCRVTGVSQGLNAARGGDFVSNISYVDGGGAGGGLFMNFGSMLVLRTKVDNWANCIQANETRANLGEGTYLDCVTRACYARQLGVVRLGGSATEGYIELDDSHSGTGTGIVADGNAFVQFEALATNNCATAKSPATSTDGAYIN